jgi:hypothetical protein
MLFQHNKDDALAFVWATLLVFKTTTKHGLIANKTMRAKAKKATKNHKFNTNSRRLQTNNIYMPLRYMETLQIPQARSANVYQHVFPSELLKHMRCIVAR